mmetsp:Transcript_82775/g.222014  ORF Transcript_82775/g.222014 Transcript_82775/m.222014 type:complete len:80 (+) Transcript_82775:133-372(+)|eukprot:CAMPEP_0113691320 /NCGR_PEP_ID=MMETSP0038_2-20120614/18358_1 /TAXON_ID=2898 /ORGANISM="Cryptomonas paramecium" /LENGTH=79 /DNA_ID=CAMNT_0000612897 /DNA_START=133 /DNA_END=372 /DNA_ORIENTATION=+ /assembly_acc=CAM_ASM_000170
MRPFTFVLARTTALNAVDGTWAAADDPWGAYLTDPRVEQIGGGKNAFIGNHGTTWVPVDWNTWENYNVEGVARGQEYRK